MTDAASIAALPEPRVTQDGKHLVVAVAINLSVMSQRVIATSPYYNDVAVRVPMWITASGEVLVANHFPLVAAVDAARSGRV